MIQENIWEQLSTFFKVFTTNSNIITLSIISLASLLILLLANKFKNKKITKIICIMAYLAIFGTLFYFYSSEILKLLDYLMNNIFLFLFFPNLAVYILVLVVINIIIVKSTFSKKDSNLTKVINVVFFVIFNLIFYLIIDNIITNNINVYEQLDVYTNSDLLVLIELNMKLFLIWMLVLLINKISTNLIYYIELKRTSNKKLVLEDVISEEIINTTPINVIPEFDEIEPVSITSEVIEEKETSVNNIPNIYNECIDIIPIKKNTLTIELEVNEKDEDKSSFEKSKYDGVCFSNIDILANDDINESENFKNNYQNTDDDNMQVVFDNSSNYL